MKEMSSNKANNGVMGAQMSDTGPPVSDTDSGVDKRLVDWRWVARNAGDV